jgi:hypothetical protein
LQLNASSGNFYGGIYATRVARELGVLVWRDDPIIPTQYLDFDAMGHHKFLKGDVSNFTYNLRFHNEDIVHTYLPAPALFDYNSKGIHYVLKSEACAHNAEVEAARAEAAAPRTLMVVGSSSATVPEIGKGSDLGVCFGSSKWRG